MKKILLALIILTATTISAQDKYQIIVENKSARNLFGINDFYFTHQVFADAFFMTDLYKQLDYEEMNEILVAVQNGVTLEDKVTILVPQENGIEAKLVFMVKDHSENGKTFVMLTNFNKASRTFEEFDDKESVVRWYYIRGDKLVYRKDEFTKSEERKKKKGAPHELIDYYLFDDNVNNDSEVKGLIEDLLEKEDSEIEQLYGRLYLGEYHLLHGEIDKAEQALKDLKTYFEKEIEIPRQYSLVVNMATTEFELMKRRKT